MNIHDYIEKNASLRQKYLKGVGRIADAIAGQGDDLRSVRSLRVIPAAAFEAVAAPISTAKWAMKSRRDLKDEFRDIDKIVSDLQRQLKEGNHNLTPSEVKSKKDKLSQFISELTGAKSGAKAFQRNASIGMGIGYGTLGYGGYKGGQKVKSYLQDKKRGR